MNENFFQEIWKCLKQPWKFTAFLLYFFLIVIAVGMLDVWVSIFEVATESAPFCDISKNLSAFALAIIAASLVDVNLNTRIKARASLVISTLALTLLAGLLFFLSYKIETHFSILPALLSAFLGLGIWVLANYQNPNLRDENFNKAMRGKGHGKNWGS